MSTFRKKEGKTFEKTAALLCWDIDRQIEELNNIYRGKVEFYRYNYFEYSERPARPAICLKWSADDIEDLELPECGYICLTDLFHPDYEGNIKTIRLPYCLKSADIDEMGNGLSRRMMEGMSERHASTDIKLHKVVIRPGTELKSTEGCTIVREFEDGSVKEDKLVITQRLDWC